MKHFIFILIAGLGMIGSVSAKEHYILRMKGDTSIFSVIEVSITVNASNVEVTDFKSGKDFLILKKVKDIFSGKFNGYDGEYGLILKQNKKKFTGTFIFEPNEKGKERFYQRDKGECQMIPYEKKTLAVWKNELDRTLYRMDCYKNIEDMAKHSPWARNYIEKRKKITNSKNVPIKFYGQVLDQFDKPVVNADVYCSIDFTPLIMWSKRNKDFHLKTDKDGRFYISGRGNEVMIGKIECKGYRTRVHFKGSYSYNSRSRNTHIPDPKHPVVFTLSKITDKATFLLRNNDFDIEFEANKTHYYSFIDLSYNEETSDYRENYETDFLPKHYDFKVDAVFDEKKSNWIVTFTASGNNGGFILSDKFLYEAPEKGYKKEFRFVQHVPTEKEIEISKSDEPKAWDTFQELSKFVLKDKFLYIKSREPSIYSRIKFKDAAIDKESGTIDTSTAANPYGERNLEFYDDLPLEISDECSNIDKYFIKGKLPPKANIKKMMTEFKKTHKRVKSGYGNWMWEKK
jgi:hypothetical protein